MSVSRVADLSCIEGQDFDDGLNIVVEYCYQYHDTIYNKLSCLQQNINCTAALCATKVAVNTSYAAMPRLTTTDTIEKSNTDDHTEKNKSKLLHTMAKNPGIS